MIFESQEIKEAIEKEINLYEFQQIDEDEIFNGIDLDESDFVED